MSPSRSRPSKPCRESEERFRVLAEAAAEGVCISDSDQIVSANLAFSSMYGYAADEVVGLPIASLVVPEQRDAALALHDEEDAVSGEFFALRKDGTRFPALASSRTSTYRGRSVRVTAVTDLTPLKLSLALEERRRVARDLHDGLAHELSFIASKTKTATRIAPSAEVLEALAGAADRALDEARRAISVLSSGDPPPLPVAIAQTAEDMCERSLVALALEMDADIRVPAYAVENLLRILREAIVNAGRHGLAEKVTVRLWEDDRVHLTIEDDGRGFDPAEPARGFGLISMRERARAVGGDLRLESGAPAGHPHRGDAVRDVVRVLIADDHAGPRASVRQALEDDGGFVMCAEAEDGPSAFDRAIETRPDVCLLDINMPGNGIAATARIAAALPGTPIVILTVSRDDNDLFDALRAGSVGLPVEGPRRRPSRARRSQGAGG